MAKSEDKRLREIEIHLTPKQWAIAYAKEMQQHSSELEFLKTLGRESQNYRELPFVKPFFALSQQAKRSYPGKNAHDFEALTHLSQRLRKDFQFLKLLISEVNDCAEKKSYTFKLRTAFELSKLDAMITRNIWERKARRLTSWIAQHRSDFGDIGLKEILNDLRACATDSDSNVDTPSSCVHGRPSSSIEDSADDLAMLVNEVFAYKAAIRGIQGKYFEGHPILWRDNEANLEVATQSILNGVAIFNEYLKKSGDVFVQESAKEARTRKWMGAAKRNYALSIDVERIRELSELLAGAIASQWVAEANDRASIAILKESSEHKESILESLRKLSKPKFPAKN